MELFEASRDVGFVEVVAKGRFGIYKGDLAKGSRRWCGARGSGWESEVDHGSAQEMLTCSQQDGISVCGSKVSLPNGKGVIGGGCWCITVGAGFNAVEEQFRGSNQPHLYVEVTACADSVTVAAM